MKKLVVLVIFLMALMGTAYAADTVDNPLDIDIFPIEELQAGLKGTAHTVIRGVEIETFNVEILELIPHGGFDGGPMILARFTGPVVDFSNGIAGGYSGSPVYINKKLVGAVSMAMPFTDTHIGGITPIQSMLKALPDAEEFDFSSNTVLPDTDNNGTPVDEEGKPVISYVDDIDAAREFNDRMYAMGIEHYQAVRATTPVYFSAVSPRVIEKYGPQLREALGSNFELMTRPMGKAAENGLFLREKKNQAGLFLTDTSVEPPLRAGDAVAVGLVEGDIEMYAIGTVTYSDAEGRVLMFGHPMLAKGDSQLPFGKAYVTWTYESIMRAFKEGVRLNTCGVLTKDHAAACGGSWKLEPDMIPVTLTVKDIDLDSKVVKHFNVARDPDMMSMLISMAISQAVTEVLDRQANGTVRVSYDVRGMGLKEPIRRANYYYDDFDVSFNTTTELMPLLELLQHNIYREVKVEQVSLLLEITRNRINASIDEAEIINDEDKPAAEGEQVLTEEPIDEPLPEIDPELEPGLDNEEVAGEPATDEPAQEPVPPVDGQEVPVDQIPYAGDMPPMDQIPQYMPGDTIRVKVRLQPFRTEPVFREFSVTVPEDYPAGPTDLVIHGGGDLTSAMELGGKGRSLYGMGPVIQLDERDLDDIISQVIEWPLNNELLVTLMRPYDPELDELGYNADGEKIELKTDAKYQMEWVIYNGYYLPVEIVTEETLAMAEETGEVEPSASEGDEPPADDDEKIINDNYRDMPF